MGCGTIRRVAEQPAGSGHDSGTCTERPTYRGIASYIPFRAAAVRHLRLVWAGNDQSMLQPTDERDPRRVLVHLEKEAIMSNTTLIIVIILVLAVFGGGGGYYWGRRRR